MAVTFGAPADADTPAPTDVTVAHGTTVTTTLRGETITGTVEWSGPLRAATMAAARQGIRTTRLGLRVPGRDSLVYVDSDKVTPADAEQAPVTVEIRWTHREGQRLTGLLEFPGVENTGREPQFLITGGMRRKTLDGFNDYDPADGFTAKGTPEHVARLAADWLGLTGRELKIVTDHEWRLSH